jgi:dolichol-phosphate mannosyltransferase
MKIERMWRSNVSEATLVQKINPEWQYPDFTEDAFKAIMNKYCVCVFVINEGDRVRNQLKRMKPYSKQIDIVVADGGSTDGSLDKEFLKSVNVTALLTKTGPGKLSAQMRMAFAWALSRGYEGVVVVDGNGKDSIDKLPDFISLLNEGYDHIQGSRFITGGKAVNTPILREIGLHVLHAPLISLASGRRQTDTTNGFRAYSAKLLRDERVSVFRDVFQTYELHYHLAIESSRIAEFKTIETPVTRTYPKTGKTPTKISPIKGNLHILKVLFKAVSGGYRLKK